MASTNALNTSSVNLKSLSLVTYNMHGFNQGVHTVRDLINDCKPDIFALQEHWLTPSNMYKFDDNFPGYVCAGISAMADVLKTGVLKGRPFGGVAILVNKSHMKYVKIVCASERFVIILLGDILIVNIYLPCAGTVNRQFIYEETLHCIQLWVQQYPSSKLLLCGDMNTDLDNINETSLLINDFISDNNLTRCDKPYRFTNQNSFTFYNDASKASSFIDYIVVSNNLAISDFCVLDLNFNLSDHRPVACKMNCLTSTDITSNDTTKSSYESADIVRLRWDKGNLDEYKDLCGKYLRIIYDTLSAQVSLSFTSQYDANQFIDYIYDRILEILNLCADKCVPKVRKNFFKFWWDTEMDELKQRSIVSCKIWKDAGRPNSGDIFHMHRKDKAAYKLAIRKHQREETQSYTNELHECLLQKQGPMFWRTWRSKLEQKSSNISQVNGITDPPDIVEIFVKHFADVSSHTASAASLKLTERYNAMRDYYVGNPISDQDLIDAELVEKIINRMSLGKAAGLDSISLEHLRYCHPMSPVVLSMLFNLMIRCSSIPDKFCYSYIVPLLKNNVHSNSKSITANDFRGIAISPVISKVFEHCLLDRYLSYFVSSENQFGFKKGSGCTNAIFSLRSVVNYFVDHNSTVNICALDLSKAFDKMNHHGLYIKLMERTLPLEILRILETWFHNGNCCIRWGKLFSTFFTMSCGVRQGGVLSPYLFAVYIDCVIESVIKLNIGCKIRLANFSILVYADDIILIAPTVTALQDLLKCCELALTEIDMKINPLKSCCIRIGPDFDVNPKCIVTQDGVELPWLNEIRYLGSFLVSKRNFNCSLHACKCSFYVSFNAIYGKIGTIASEDVILHLVKSKCLPRLLYGLEVLPLNNKQFRSLEFVINSCFAKILKTKSNDIINACKAFFSFPDLKNEISSRNLKFANKLKNSCLKNFLATTIMTII